MGQSVDPALLLEPSADYLSSMGNIPQISANAILSIWTLASSSQLRDTVVRLLKEINVLPVAASSWQQQKFGESAVFSDELTTEVENADAESIETLSNFIGGKRIVFTGSLMHSSGGKSSPISRAHLIGAVKRLGMLLSLFPRCIL